MIMAQLEINIMAQVAGFLAQDLKLYLKVVILTLRLPILGELINRTSSTQTQKKIS
jgi:hypothetical protein